MDKGGKATIGIDRESLSEENQALAEQVPNHQILTVGDTEAGPKVLILFFPIERHKTPIEVGQQAAEVAAQFA